MPGFVDLHVHTGGGAKAPDAEYVYKLWLAHGVTTVRGVPAGPMDWTLRERERSARNAITAPRIFAYHRPGTGEGWTGGADHHAGEGDRVGELGGQEGHRRAQARRRGSRDHEGADHDGAQPRVSAPPRTSPRPAWPG